ncbi:MAG: hypothetical protein ACHQQS_06435 [Thermoanaerobaculales bacterium]
MSPLSESQWGCFLCVAGRVVPAATQLDTAALERFRDIVLKALADRPRAVQRQFALFLGVIRWAPLVRFGSRFERLGPDRQDKVLRFLMRAPLGKLRSGFWGLRALVFMGYYARPEVWPEISYAPSFDGNERLHG